MLSFQFHLPTRIEIGVGLFKETPRLIKETIKGDRLLIVTDPGIEKVGFVEKLKLALEQNGYTTHVFNQVKPNPKDVDCVVGGEVAREFKADAIIALGGGSVIDSAKAIAVLQTHGGKPQDVEGRGNIPGEVTPVVAIPTTAGTGAEVTRSSVITDTTRNFKMTIKDVKIAPKLAIADPELTYKLPPHLTASTGMDALVHAIEAYTCKRSNPIADHLAIGAIKHLFPHIRTAVFDGEDIEARSEMMVGSLVAGMAFSHADVASVHCMSEAIGGKYDTPHGVANSMFLPYVTAFNISADVRKHAKLARVFGVADERTDDLVATELLVEELRQLAEDISIPTFASLPNVNVDDFEELARASYLNGSTPSNAREITEEDYLQLFKKAYVGKL